MISVVIPTYRRTDALARALASAQAQQGVPFDDVEILVIGDACPDLAPSRFVGTVPFKFRTYFHNLSRNHNDLGATARNHGILCARGDLIAYLDDDNTWEPNHLQTLLFALKDAQWAFSWMRINTRIHKLTGHSCGQIDTSTLLHKKDLIFKYGFWHSHKEVSYAHDWDLVKQWVLAGVLGNCTYCPTLNYTLHVQRAP